MSRAALYDAILADARLQALGFDATNVKVNYDAPQRPSDELFIVITFGQDDVVLRGDDSTFVRTAKPVTIWVHMYREFSTDFVRIDRIIDILNDVVANCIQIDGADGY